MDSFEQRPAREQEPLAYPQYHYWQTPAGEAVASFHRPESGYLVRFAERADFVIDAGCELVTCYPVPDISQEVLSSLFHNQIVPLILSHKGHLVLHGSGVSTNGGALGFIGATGHGKSTLAAAFASRGHPFITDDGLVLTRDAAGYLAQPNNPRFRLLADSELAIFGSATHSADGNGLRKRHIPASQAVPFQQAPARLQAIYLLGDGSAQSTQISDLKPAEAMSELISHCFILDIEDRKQLRAHFDRLAELAISQPCFALDFPRRYDYLPRAIADVLAHAGKGGC